MAAQITAVSSRPEAVQKAHAEAEVALKRAKEEAEVGTSTKARLERLTEQMKLVASDLCAYRARTTELVRA